MRSPIIDVVILAQTIAGMALEEGLYSNVSC